MREFIRRNNPFNRHFVRNLEAGTLLEIFLVTAVCSVLGIRFFLALTGYPSLSPGHLHIAHVLLGGVLMMIALVINLGYINKSANYLVAVIGGLGFGAFIDELGKFITGDNDYFFQPTVALIYIIFALLYLAIQTFIQKPKLTEQERLVNVLELAKEAVLEDLDHLERRKALALLKESSQNNPMTRALQDLLHSTDSVPMPKIDIYTATKYRMRRYYRRLIKKSWFIRVVMAFFILQSIFTLGLDFMLIYLRLNSGKGLDAIFPSLSFFDLAGLAAATLSSTLVIYAILKMKSSRLEAYRIFKNAILVQIFIVQVILFYLTQFIALLGLAGNICILLVLNYMIIQETNSSRGQENSV
jgi:hypothetical protein